MGCESSRKFQNEEQIGEYSCNYYTLRTAFVGGPNDTDQLSLAPIDKLDHMFKQSLPEGSYGTWDKKMFELNNNLKFVDED